MGKNTDNTPLDIDASETQEWLASLDAVLANDGGERAHYLLQKLIERARASGVYMPFSARTPYINTIPVDKEEYTPGDPAIEWRLRSIIRWNAIAMVVRANREAPGIGGHIASYASAATLYEVGFNHFFHAPSENHGGDSVFFQGHCAPGIYARAYLYGQLSEDQLNNFRREAFTDGLSSYPHPWLMPNFWQFPTVSMGLGPMMAIHQARFMRYMHDRGLADNSNRKVWAFMGDGEMDEPESMGAISLAGHQKLDNLIFVINCNLQRLDGPVRGNGKVIQEYEEAFRGAGWNVIKVIWGSQWDALLAQDHTGLLKQRMEECVDGEYQAYKAHGGAYVRKHFFGAYPELERMVSHMSDEDIGRLNRGGHDPHKVYAAYAAAVAHTGQPTVILAKTVKGYGMGEAGEGQNFTHQQKKMGEAALRQFRDRFDIPITDEQITETPFFKPDPDSEEMRYLRERRESLGGFLLSRRKSAEALEVPPLEAFAKQLETTGKREISTTMAFVRVLNTLVKDKTLGPHVVPIVPDEARTFGMEGMFRQLGIYSSVGQLYDPVDHDQVMYYREDKKGQILEEGINEAGAFSSWIAAATAYSTHGHQMVPFYIYYSMFGFQRIGDLAWAAADMQARGFLLGGTAGRTTLEGEGLQHQDGQSHILASVIPNCVSYDPTYSYEVAVIIQEGLRRMNQEQENVFYYITLLNENYVHPAYDERYRDGILRGMYLLEKGAKGKLRVQLLGAGSILREVLAAAQILKTQFKVSADVWSTTSFTELRRDGLEVERWNLLHPEEKPRQSYVEQCLGNSEGPVVASTDYMKALPDLIRPFINKRYLVLGTDGFGRSDTREALRKFFEIDRHYVVVAALKALADEGSIEPGVVSEAMRTYNIDPDRPSPVTI